MIQLKEISPIKEFLRPEPSLPPIWSTPKFIGGQSDMGINPTFQKFWSPESAFIMVIKFTSFFLPNSNGCRRLRLACPVKSSNWPLNCNQKSLLMPATLRLSLDCTSTFGKWEVDDGIRELCFTPLAFSPTTKAVLLVLLKVENES